jgi:hypothetical protein
MKFDLRQDVVAVVFVEYRQILVDQGNVAWSLRMSGIGVGLFV